MKVNYSAKRTSQIGGRSSYIPNLYYLDKRINGTVLGLSLTCEWYTYVKNLNIEKSH